MAVDESPQGRRRLRLRSGQPDRADRRGDAIRIRAEYGTASRAGPQADHACWSGMGQGVDTRQGIRRPQGPSAGTQTINQKKEAIRL